MSNSARIESTAMATHLSKVERLSFAGEGDGLGSGLLLKIRHVELSRLFEKKTADQFDAKGRQSEVYA